MKQFELNYSVLTPDVKICTTILIGVPPNYNSHDKSVAKTYEQSAVGITFTYENKEQIFIPWSGIRYIYLKNEKK